MNKTHVIIPAILEPTKESIVGKYKKIKHLVDTVQVDICDGRFVPSKTYGSSGNEQSIKQIISLGKKYGVTVGLDMMVDLDFGNRMEQWSRVLCTQQPVRVIFHLGSTYRWDELFTMIRRCSRDNKIPFECGLAVRVGQTRREIARVFDNHPFDFIQVMGIEKVGYSGQKFSHKTYEKIKKIRRKYSDIHINVDGGVGVENAQKLFASGATRLGVNSGLFKTASLEDTLQELQKM